MSKFKIAVAIVSVFASLHLNAAAQAQNFYGDPDYSTYGAMPEDVEDARNERELINRPGMNHYPERGPHTIPESEVYPFSDHQIPRNPVAEDQFYGNRDKMGEAVRDLGLGDDDQAAIVDHVLDDGGWANANSLRESEISDEGWNQIRDDARFR